MCVFYDGSAFVLSTVCTVRDCVHNRAYIFLDSIHIHSYSFVLVVSNSPSNKSAILNISHISKTQPGTCFG